MQSCALPSRPAAGGWPHPGPPAAPRSSPSSFSPSSSSSSFSSRAPLLALLTGLLLWLVPAPARALPEQTWVITIGNNRGDASDVQLLYAERDAREVTDVLRSQGGIASDRVRQLVDEDEGTVRRTLLEVNTALRRSAAGTPTALLVFYSGHADAEALHLRGTQLPLEELRGLVTGSPATVRVLVVDACRSGAVTRVKGVRPAPEFLIKLDTRIEAEGTAILSSSTAGESSQESDRLRASFFSHHLVNALRGAADRNGDGRVTLSEAYDYTYAQTLRSSGQTLTLQHPTYAYDVKGSGELVLTSVTAGRGGARLRLGAQSQYLITEERESGAVVAELLAPRPRALVSMPHGRYFVQQRGSLEYREYQLALRPDEEVDLERLPYRAVRYDQLVRKRGGARRSVHGLMALAGVRGEVLPGEGPTPNLVLGYSADLPYLTVGTRLRGDTAPFTSVDGGLHGRRYELGLSLLLQRYIDLPWLSLAFGVSLEGALVTQRFGAGDRPVAPRTGVNLGFGALFAIERHLYRGLALRLEGGPLAVLERRGTVLNGAETGTELDSMFTYWLAGGLVWRL